LALTEFQFDPTDGLENKVSFPKSPGSEEEARAQVQTPMNQIRDYINTTLKTEVDAKETPEGAQAKADAAESNANNYTDSKVDDLAGTGRTTETVKGNADDLATHKNSSDHDGRYYTETEVDAKVDDLAGAGRTTETVMENRGFIGTLANLITSAKDNLVNAINEVFNSLNDLAGAGRTTETVKGNADDLATHLAKNAIDAHAVIPAARVYHSVAQSIANNTLTALAFDSERFDTDSIHDVTTNNTRLTCNTAGKYFISGNISFAGNDTGYRYVNITLNGTTKIAIKQCVAVAGGYSTIVTIGTVYELAANDYVELCVLQNSGGALDIEFIGNYSPEFMMVKVG